MLLATGTLVTALSLVVRTIMLQALPWDSAAIEPTMKVFRAIFVIGDAMVLGGFVRLRLLARARAATGPDALSWSSMAPPATIAIVFASVAVVTGLLRFTDGAVGSSLSTMEPATSLAVALFVVVTLSRVREALLPESSTLVRLTRVAFAAIGLALGVKMLRLFGVGAGSTAMAWASFLLEIARSAALSMLATVLAVHLRRSTPAKATEGPYRAPSVEATRSVLSMDLKEQLSIAAPHFRRYRAGLLIRLGTGIVVISAVVVSGLSRSHGLLYVIAPAPLVSIATAVVMTLALRKLRPLASAVRGRGTIVGAFVLFTMSSLGDGIVALGELMSLDSYRFDRDFVEILIVTTPLTSGCSLLAYQAVNRLIRQHAALLGDEKLARVTSWAADLSVASINLALGTFLISTQTERGYDERTTQLLLTYLMGALTVLTFLPTLFLHALSLVQVEDAALALSAPQHPARHEAT